MNGDATRTGPEPAPARGLILTHGTLGAEMLATAALIVGHSEGLTAMSNRGLGAAEIAAEVESFHAQDPATPLIVFVDLLGGSCAQGCAALLAGSHVRLVTGVNLPMVIAFLQARDQKLGLDGLVAAILMRAHRGIACFPAPPPGSTGAGEPPAPSSPSEVRA